MARLGAGTWRLGCNMAWSLKVVIAVVFFVLAWAVAIMQGSALAPMFLLLTSIAVIIVLPIP